MMHRLQSKVREFGHLTQHSGFLFTASTSPWGLGLIGGFAQSSGPYKPQKMVVVNSFNASYSSNTTGDLKDLAEMTGISVSFARHFSRYISSIPSKEMNMHYTKQSMLPCFTRILSSNYSAQSSRQENKDPRKDISTIEDPFDDAPTYNIPEKPVTFVEGASYSVLILAGLGVASLAAYAVFKELIFEPKEYKIFGKALERVQNESQASQSTLTSGLHKEETNHFSFHNCILISLKCYLWPVFQVRVRVGSPVTGYGQESRNRAARQRISDRVWKDEDGVEHVEVNFYIRGPHGAGKVFAEMFKDNSDKQWKFTYLIVEIMSPTHAQLMLESHVPAYAPTQS